MIPVNGVEISKTTAALNVGKTDALTVTVNPDNAANKNVSWTSSDPTVASVDENGKVTALKVGITKITATALSGSGKYNASCIVTVTDKILGDINEDGNVDGKDDEQLRKMIIGMVPKNDLADLNADGKVNVCDLVKLKLI